MKGRPFHSMSAVTFPPAWDTDQPDPPEDRRCEVCGEYSGTTARDSDGIVRCDICHERHICSV